MNFVILVATAGILFQSITCVEIIPQKIAFQPIIAQHLGQDALGHYTYGYITPTSTKSESKGVDGVIRGGYSYLDPKGHLQSVQYIADPHHGFLVAASNLPQDVPSVAYAKQRHLQKYEQIKAEHAAVAVAKQVPQAEIQYEASSGIIAPNKLPQDVPVVAYAKQRHLEKYEAIKAQHAALALAKNNPEVAAIISNPVTDLPAVANAKAKHLAAFEEVKARDLALQAARAAADKELGIVNSYAPIVPLKGLNYYTYGYVHPVPINGALYNAIGKGYSYIDPSGEIKTVNYLTR